jgi:hypothetical protein
MENYQREVATMKFVKPKANDTFTITSAPSWPSIVFETDGSGAHTWTWTITWHTFKKTGKANTLGNSWDAQSVVNNLGGTLTVRADTNKFHATTTVKIVGTNPSAADVKTYLKTKSSVEGFDKIIAQESRFLHFNKHNEPIKSFDNGYGMCQLTKPVPTFEQVWNWKLNIDGGVALFASKRLDAISYLSHGHKTYTTDQLTSETVGRWNGGSYHEWDAKGGKWVRHATILCDSRTGNIGWNMDDSENKGKTEDQLHKRDSASYAKHTNTAHWNYYGVCYADHLLGTTPVTPATAATPAASTATKSGQGAAPGTGPTPIPTPYPTSAPAPSTTPLPMPPLAHPEAHPYAPSMNTGFPTKLG